MSRARVSTLGLAVTAVAVLAGCPRPVALQTTGTLAMPYDWTDQNLTKQRFDEYLQELDFSKTDTVQERPCKATGGACSNPSDRVSVEIRPDSGARNLNPTDLDAKGHVIARIINRGNATEAKYNLPGNAKEVYWLVTNGVSRFVYFDQAGKKRVASITEYSECPPHTPNTTLRAAFQPCPGSLQGQFFMAQPASPSPAWISCLEGCCVAESFSQ